MAFGTLYLGPLLPPCKRGFLVTNKWKMELRTSDTFGLCVSLVVNIMTLLGFKKSISSRAS